MRKLKKDGEIHRTLTGFDFLKDKPLSPRRAMRMKCLECATTAHEVKKCPLTDCGLWPYRLGVGICTNREGVRDESPRSAAQLDAAERNLGKARAATG
jgi:hypothetical protein